MPLIPAHRPFQLDYLSSNPSSPPPPPEGRHRSCQPHDNRCRSKKRGEEDKKSEEKSEAEGTEISEAEQSRAESHNTKTNASISNI